MKFPLVLVLSASFSLLAAAQAPATSVPAIAPAPATTARARSDRGAPEANPGRRSPGATLPAMRDSAQTEQTQPTVHRRRHWLRWAIVGAAAIVGVIAIIAYEHNYGGPSYQTNAHP